MMQFIGQHLNSDVRNNHDFSPCLTFSIFMRQINNKWRLTEVLASRPQHLRGIIMLRLQTL